jgi:hypothetical protein
MVFITLLSQEGKVGMSVTLLNIRHQVHDCPM